MVPYAQTIANVSYDDSDTGKRCTTTDQHH